MMDDRLLGANASVPNTSVNAIRRFGRYYVRRKRHNSGANVERLNIEIVPCININESTENLIQINQQNRIRGQLSQPTRPTAFHPFTSVLAIGMPVLHVNTTTLIDVPIQNENAFVSSIQLDVRNHSDGLIEVPIQDAASSPRPTKRPHHDDGLIEVPIQAATSLSRPTKRSRRSRSRRVDFDSIVLPTPPRKLSAREKNAIRQRRFRARQTNEQRLASQAKQNIRRRNARLRQTPQQRAAAQALDTTRRRVARQIKRAQQQRQDTQSVLTRAETNAIIKEVQASKVCDLHRSPP